jgi:hypothetical protein
MNPRDSRTQRAMLKTALSAAQTLTPPHSCCMRLERSPQHPRATAGTRSPGSAFCHWLKRSRGFCWHSRTRPNMCLRPTRVCPRGLQCALHLALSPLFFFGSKPSCAGYRQNGLDSSAAVHRPVLWLHVEAHSTVGDDLHETWLTGSPRSSGSRGQSGYPAVCLLSLSLVGPVLFGVDQKLYSRRRSLATRRGCKMYGGYFASDASKCPEVAGLKCGFIS